MQATSGFGLDALPTEPWVPAPDEAAIVSDAFARRAPLVVADADRRHARPRVASARARGAAAAARARRRSHRAARHRLQQRGAVFAAKRRRGRSPTRFSRRSSSSACVSATSCSAICGCCSTSSRRAFRRRCSSPPGSTSSATAPTGCSAPTARRSGFTIGARASSCCGRRPIPSTAGERRADPARTIRCRRRRSPCGARAPRFCGRLWLGDRGGGDGHGDGAAARHAAARSAPSSSKACASSPAASSTCSTAPTSSDVSCRTRSRTSQLLDDVMRSRRELENTFDSIAHLVVVFDRRGRIVHVNKAFAARVGRTREQLLDRPLADFIGPELAAWLAELANEPTRPEGRAPAIARNRGPGAEGARSW